MIPLFQDPAQSQRFAFIGLTIESSNEADPPVNPGHVAGPGGSWPCTMVRGRWEIAFHEVNVLVKSQGSITFLGCFRARSS